MFRKTTVAAGMTCCLIGAADAQTVSTPAPRGLVVPQTAPNLARPVILACPPQLVTNVIAVEIKPPWSAASATVTLMGAVIRQESQRAVLNCAYKATAATYEHVSMWTHAPLGACVVGADQKSFACLQGTTFSPK